MTKLKSKSLNFAICTTTLLIGCWLSFHHTLSTHFNLVIGDLGDTRLNALFLEHNFLYLFDSTKVGSYWSPNWLFFPSEDTFAYSDVMASGLPIYAVFRWLGYQPLVALMQWMIVCTALNFTCFFLLARSLKLDSLKAILAATIFAFALPRAGFSNHPQLYPQFFSVLGFLFLARVYQGRSVCGQSWRDAFLCGLFFALQLWTSIYLFYFDFLLCLVGIFVILLTPSIRPDLFNQLREKWRDYSIAVGSLLFFAGPLIFKYLQTKRNFGGRSYSEIAVYLPEVQQLLQPFYGSKFYGWLTDLVSIHPNPGFWEKYVFIGMVALVGTTASILLALYKPKFKWHRALAIITLIMLFAPLRSEILKFWSIFYGIPGADAIRAPGRLVLVTLGLSGLCTALALSYIPLREHIVKTLTLVLILLFLFESQTKTTWTFQLSEHEKLIAQITSHSNFENCEILIAPASSDAKLSVNLMWAAMQYGKKTINGYSGQSPQLAGYETVGENQIAVAGTKYSACLYE